MKSALCTNATNRSRAPTRLAPNQDRGHAGFGETDIGKPQQAQEHLRTATMMYREMDMAFWLEKAETEMEELA